MGSCVSLGLKKHRKKNKTKTKEVVVSNVAASPEISEEMMVTTVPALLEVSEETMMTTMATLSEISEELLIEILVRLPVKSLMRFKCVSKLWLSLITSRFFSNLFLKTSPRSRFTVYIVNHLRQSEYLLLTSSNHDYSDTSLSVTLDKDLSMPEIKGGHFMSYVRGLVCFKNVGRVQVCNFSTRQVIELPRIEGSYRENQMWCCFGHDPINDEYKVLSTVWEVSRDEERLVTSKHHVWTLGSGGSWRKTRNHIPHHPFNHYYKGLIINGVLYYGGWTDKAQCVVMSFDFSSEEFKMYEMPTTFHTFPNFSYVELMIYKGKLAVFECFTLFIDGKVNVWVLEEDGGKKKSPWLEKMTFVLPFSEMNFFIGEVLKMGSTGRSGELWFTNEDVSWTQPSFFFSYDLERNEITARIVTRPLPNNFRQSFWMLATLWDNDEKVMYLET